MENIEVRIRKADHGFIVSGMYGKQWAFETPKSLSEFILEWGNKNITGDDIKTAATFLGG